MAIRIVVADWNALFREGIIAFIRTNPDITVVAAAKTVTELHKAITTHRPEVVLMELILKKESSLPVVRQFPDTAFCVLSISEQPDDLFEAVRAGVRGYLAKTVTLEALIASIATIADGGAVVMPHLMVDLLQEYARLSSIFGDPTNDEP